MEIIPITSLSPQSAPPAAKCIRAVVTLSWPYSSSSRQCALLLADPDFRLRNRKGQVRVRFSGPSAEAVAKSHVGIGDEVVLALDGASWERDPEATRTPGKSVDGELLFKRRLRLGITREQGGEIQVRVDAPASPPRETHEEALPIATPLPNAVTHLLSGLNDSDHMLPAYTYTSPAFVKRLRLSGDGFTASAYDPFAAYLRDAEQSGGGRRTSFGSITKWRYTERTPSPEKDRPGEGVRHTLRDDAAQDVSPISTEDLPQTHSQLGQLTTEMPQLLELSPQSPAKQIALEPALEVEAIDRQPEEPFAPQSPLSPSPAIPLPQRPAEAGLIPWANASASPLSLYENQSSNVQSRMLGEEEVAEMLDQDVLMQDTAETTSPVNTVLDEQNDLSNAALLNATPKHSSRPQTRANIDEQPLTGFRISTPASNSLQFTPQSEREKIMAQTFRSLFGFKASPEPTSPPPARDEITSPTPAKTIWTMQAYEAGSAGTSVGIIEHRLPEAEIPFSVVDFDEKNFNDRGHAQDIQEPAAQRPPIEVIDLDSSSDEEEEKEEGEEGKESEEEEGKEREEEEGKEREEEEEEEEEKILSIQPAILPVPQRALLKPENLDSLIEPLPEDLVGSSNADGSIGGESTLRQMALEAAETLAGGMHGTTGPEIPHPEKYEFATLHTDTASDTPRIHAITLPLHTTQVETSQPLSSTGHQSSNMEFESQLNGVISSAPGSNTSTISRATSPLVPDLTQEYSVADDIHWHPPTSEPVVGRERYATLTTPPQSSFERTVIELTSSSPLTSSQPSPEVLRAQSDTQFDDRVDLELEGGEASDLVAEHSLNEAPNEVEIKPELMILGESARAVVYEREPLHSGSVPETITYPSLPLSPSNSQSMSNVLSQTENATSALHAGTDIFLPTPQLTQQTSFTQLDGTLAREPLPSLQEENMHVHEEQHAVEEPYTPEPNKMPAKKSLTARISNIPDVISDWFAPRRSSGVVVDINSQTRTYLGENASLTEEQIPSDVQQPRKVHMQESHGLSTSFSYFTPLSRLEGFLNPSSQQTPGSNTVDVFAIVTDRTAEPVRAKAGPRDYFTIFKIADTSLSAETNVRVETYRPWKATLPMAAKGDVILLRAFAVKSRKRQPYLLSTDTSAWCVWRYGESPDADDTGDKPIWASKAGIAAAGVKEEIKGPPVELGDEERAHAKGMREWWQAVRSEQDEYDAWDGMQIAGQISNAEPVAAKF